MLFTNVEFCERLATTLAHSLWQGMFVGLVFILLTNLMKMRGPEVRHTIGVICLGLLVLSLPVTFLSITPQQLRKVEAVKSLSLKNEAIARLPQAERQTEIAETSAYGQNISSATGNQINRSWHVGWRQWAQWLCAFYFFGVVMGVTRLGSGVWACHVLCRAATPLTDPEWLQRVDLVRSRIGLRAAPAVFWCQTSLVPTIVGFLRPVILLPVAFATGVTPEQIEQILCHEMMHIRRRDALFNLLISIAEVLLFFHPVVWIISRRIRLERELCCDAVVASSKDERWRYAQLLVELAERAHRSSLAANQLAIVSDPSHLRVRIDALLRRPTTRNGYLELRSLVLLAIVVLGLASFANRSVPAAPPAEAPNAKNHQFPIPNPALPAWVIKQQEIAEKELQNQKEQIELSRDWPLKFPQNVQENELAGVIVDSEGHPIAGALVHFYPAITGYETTTDDQGMFRYQFKDSGRNETFEVRFSKEGFSPIYRRNQALGVKDFRVVLNSKTYLEGRVVDQQGKPVPKARAFANHPKFWGGTYPSFDRRTATMADENGQYRLYLFPETYTVAVVSDGQGVERINDVVVKENQGQKLDLQLNSGILFKAKVLDAETKKPVSGIVLYHRTEARMHGTSNAEGDILIPHCLPGREDLQVGFGNARLAHGYIEYDTNPLGAWWSPEATKEWHRKKTTEVALMFDLKVDMPPVTLYVETGVSISGKVIDPNGNPVAKATVADARTGTGNSLTGDTRYSVETTDDGTYQIYLPPSGAGEYNLMAHDGSYLKWRQFAAGITEPMRTKPGQRIQNIDIQLYRAGTVSGRVIAEEGRNVGGLEVRAHAYDKRGNRYYDPTTKTKEDGTFEINFIRPGKHYIEVEPMWMNPQDGPAASYNIVELSEGESKDGIELKYVGDKR